MVEQRITTSVPLGSFRPDGAAGSARGPNARDFQVRTCHSPSRAGARSLDSSPERRSGHGCSASGLDSQRAGRGVPTSSIATAASNPARCDVTRSAALERHLLTSPRVAQSLALGLASGSGLLSSVSGTPDCNAGGPITQLTGPAINLVRFTRPLLGSLIRLNGYKACSFVRGSWILLGALGGASAPFMTACNNATAPSVTRLRVYDINVPASASATSPLTVDVTVGVGGCTSFDRFNVARKPSSITLTAIGRDFVPPTGGACTMELRLIHRTYVADPPFTDPLTVTAVQPGDTLLSKAVRIQ